MDTKKELLYLFTKHQHLALQWSHHLIRTYNDNWRAIEQQFCERLPQVSSTCFHSRETRTNLRRRSLVTNSQKRRLYAVSGTLKQQVQGIDCLRRLNVVYLNCVCTVCWRSTGQELAYPFPSERGVDANRQYFRNVYSFLSGFSQLSAGLTSYFSKYIVRQKQTIIFLPIVSPNDDRFSILAFHSWCIMFCRIVRFDAMEMLKETFRTSYFLPPNRLNLNQVNC